MAENPPNKIDLPLLEEELMSIILVDGLDQEPTKLLNDNYLTELSPKFPNIPMDDLKTAINTFITTKYKTVTSNPTTNSPNQESPKKPPHPSEIKPIADSDIIIEPPKKITLYEEKAYHTIRPEMSLVAKEISKTEQKLDQYRLLGVLDHNLFEQFVIQAKELITKDHYSAVKHKITGIYTPYINSWLARDLLGLMTNIRVGITTNVITVGKDTMVICSVSFYDQLRNSMIDGIIATEFLYKERTNPQTGEVIDYAYGDESTFEICQTRAIRRVLDYIIPRKYMKQIEKMLVDRFGIDGKKEIGSPISTDQKPIKKPKSKSESDTF